jgi:hypothetical protein
MLHLHYIYLVSTNIFTNLQNPFNVVSVSVIGDDSAVTLFRLDGASIRVASASNLAADTANSYKVRNYTKNSNGQSCLHLTLQ